MRKAFWPDGHFYSPVPDPSELEEQAARIWPQEPEVLGVDFNDRMHEHVLTELFGRHIHAYDYPEELSETRGRSPEELAVMPHLASFFTGNPAFSGLDARALFVLLREWRPNRMIEIGAGFSSLLAADVNRRFLGGTLELTSVDPYPPAFLRDGVDGMSKLITSKVQDLPLDVFAQLRSGDILFIDSSHVTKTGSDVNYLYFEVLPRLAVGVRVHIHDIFLPYDYPQVWAIEANRSWNELYLVRAFLMYNRDFRIVFGSQYAVYRFPDLVRAALPERQTMGGGSLWLERTAST